VSGARALSSPSSDSLSSIYWILISVELLTS
jgi:hypothetical protein